MNELGLYVWNGDCVWAVPFFLCESETEKGKLVNVNRKICMEQDRKMRKRNRRNADGEEWYAGCEHADT